jgi:hypothetical protein
VRVNVRPPIVTRLIARRWRKIAMTAFRRQGIGLLFFNGLSLGSIKYIMTEGGEERPTMLIRADFVNGSRLIGQWITVHLDSHQTISGYCVDASTAPWFLVERERTHAVGALANGSRHR